MLSRPKIAPVVLAMLLTSCGAARSVVPFVDPPLTPEEAAVRKVERALDRANEDAANIVELQLTARYNPAPCACPAWEVAIGGGWERVELRAARTAEPGLEAVLQGTGIAESAQLVVSAFRVDETVAGPDGRPYAVLEVGEILAAAEDP